MGDMVSIHGFCVKRPPQSYTNESTTFPVPISRWPGVQRLGRRVSYELPHLPCRLCGRGPDRGHALYWPEACLPQAGNAPLEYVVCSERQAGDGHEVQLVLLF